MNIIDSGVVGGFETSLKADTGSFSGLNFGGYEYGGNRYKAPSDNQRNWCGTSGNVADFDTYAHYLEGYTIEGLTNINEFVEAHKNTTNDFLCGFQFGTSDNYPKTYIGIKVRNWQYEDRGNYKWVNPDWAVVKRVYQDYTTFSETDISQTLGIQSRARIYLVSRQSTEVSWKLIFTFKEYTSGNESYLMFGFTYVRDDGSCNLTDNMIVSIKKSYLKNIQNIDVDTQPHGQTTESTSFGLPAYPGGYGVKDINGNTKIGNFDDTSDTIAIDNLPTFNPFGKGFLNAYEVETGTWDLLKLALFPETDFSQNTDLIAWLGSLTQVTFYKNRTDFVLGCITIPCAVTGGNYVDVTAGGTKLSYSVQGTIQNVRAKEITTPFVEEDLGYIELHEYWANFLDFCGTSAKLFLPGIGYINLKPEYFNGGKLGVKYRFNIIDGSFMCFVTSTSGVSNLTDSLIGQYSGAMCIRTPITSADYSQLASGLISSIGAGVGAVATGGASAIATGATVANLTNTLTSKPTMQGSNTYNASSSYMSHKTPYLLIERKTAQFSETYNSEIGLPLNVTAPLNQLHGFTVIDNPVLNVSCSDEEYNEICNLLKTGVIF